jgi:hypothetical protein
MIVVIVERYGKVEKVTALSILRARVKEHYISRVPNCGCTGWRLLSLILQRRRCPTQPFHNVTACMIQATMKPGDAVIGRHVPLVKEKQLLDANDYSLCADSFGTLRAAHATPPVPLTASPPACLLDAIEF